MIRPYRRSDKKHLLDIFHLNIPKYFDKSEVQDFESYLGKRAETYLTIELDHIIVGGTGYYIDETDRSGRITWIFFDPDHAGKGLGRAAVSHCHKLLEDKVEKFIVTTSQFAFRFFEKFGYRTIRTKKNYWGKDLDLYEMEKLNDQY